MKFADTVLSWASFVCVCIAVLVGPWLFGAWEMWWFWLFVLFLLVGTLSASIRLLLRSAVSEEGDREEGSEPAGTRVKAAILTSCLPFLVYALAASLRSEVYLDSERTLLLVLLPFLVALHVLCGFRGEQRRALYVLILADLVLLGLYGLVNHAVTESRLVLWRQGYEQYIVDSRATGSYFCPDHFSGIMEIALGLAVALLLSRGLRSRWKALGAALVLISLGGIVLSKSRGGGLTAIVIMLAILTWGLSQWKAGIRWGLRAGILAIGVLGILLFAHFAKPYMSRFAQYFNWEEMRGRPVREKFSALARGYSYSNRGLMVRGALRAWKTDRVFGIGPGMHKHFWPHFGPTPDGNRELGIWPSYPYYTSHATRAHCDWVQLLEEYGMVGFAFFMIPFLTLSSALLKAVRLRGRRTRLCGRETEPLAHAVVLGGLLSLVAIAFHSLGDFNLRMPATGWIFGAILALALAEFPRGEDAQGDVDGVMG